MIFRFPRCPVLVESLHRLVGEKISDGPEKGGEFPKIPVLFPGKAVFLETHFDEVIEEIRDERFRLGVGKCCFGFLHLLGRFCLGGPKIRGIYSKNKASFGSPWESR